MMHNYGTYYEAWGKLGNFRTGYRYETAEEALDAIIETYKEQVKAGYEIGDEYIITRTQWDNECYDDGEIFRKAETTTVEYNSVQVKDLVRLASLINEPKQTLERS